jgi:hypothetical protein
MRIKLTKIIAATILLQQSISIENSDIKEELDLSNMRRIKLLPLQFQVGHNIEQKEVSTQTNVMPPQSLVGMCYDIKDLILSAKGIMLGKIAIFYLTIGKYLVALLSEYNEKLKNIANNELFIICSTLNDQEFEQFANTESKKYNIEKLAKLKSNLLCIKSHINKICKIIPNCILPIDATFVLSNERNVLQRVDSLIKTIKICSEKP